LLLHFARRQEGADERSPLAAEACVSLASIGDAVSYAPNSTASWEVICTQSINSSVMTVSNSKT
jgi:hypothetical protein